MNILFYYPSNQRTNVLESQMIYFQQQGHMVHLLTLSPTGLLHTYLHAYGIQTNTQHVGSKNRISFYLKSKNNLIEYIRKHNIQVVYAHLQQANFIAMLAQHKVPNTKIIVCRHHHDRVMTGKSRNAKLFDYVINKRAKAIIVPSKMVYDQVVDIEKVDANKVHLIPYTYNFDLFPKPNTNTSNQIKQTFNHELTAILLTRLVHGKGIQETLEATKKIIDKGIDFGLIIAGDGELKQTIETFIQKHHLQNHILLTGHITNVIDYINAIDFMILLSENEASNNAVKEAAICEKPSIVCDHVGDFDDYIQDHVNGFMVKQTHKTDETTAIITEIAQNKAILLPMGKKIKETVINRFSIEKIILSYNKFHA